MQETLRQTSSSKEAQEMPGSTQQAWVVRTQSWATKSDSAMGSVTYEHNEDQALGSLHNSTASNPAIGTSLPQDFF